MQVSKCAIKKNMIINKCSCMQEGKYVNLQVWRYVSMKVCTYASTQECKNARMQVCKYESK